MAMKSGYTPTEAAVDIALGWLRAAFEDDTSDISRYANTETEKKLLRKALAKLHNRLLNKSGMDGLLIEVN